MSGEQSHFATGVNINIGGIADVANAVENGVIHTYFRLLSELNIDLNCVHIDTSSTWRDLTTRRLWMRCLGVLMLRKIFQGADKVMLRVKGVKRPSRLREVCRRSAILCMRRLLDRDRRKRHMKTDFNLCTSGQ